MRSEGPKQVCQMWKLAHSPADMSMLCATSEGELVYAPLPVKTRMRAYVLVATAHKNKHEKIGEELL